MAEEELIQLLKKNIQLSELIYASLEKQRKIRMWTMIIGIVVIIIPLIASFFILPWALGNISDYYGSIFEQLK